jgi:hypothetical protein
MSGPKTIQLYRGCQRVRSSGTAGHLAGDDLGMSRTQNKRTPDRTRNAVVACMHRSCCLEGAFDIPLHGDTPAGGLLPRARFGQTLIYAHVTLKMVLQYYLTCKGRACASYYCAAWLQCGRAWGGHLSTRCAQNQHGPD